MYHVLVVQREPWSARWGHAPFLQESDTYPEATVLHVWVSARKPKSVEALYDPENASPDFFQQLPTCWESTFSRTARNTVSTKPGQSSNSRWRKDARRDPTSGEFLIEGTVAL